MGRGTRVSPYWPESQDQPTIGLLSFTRFFWLVFGIGGIAVNLSGTCGVAKAQVSPIAAASAERSAAFSLQQFQATCMARSEFVSKVTSRLKAPFRGARAPKFYVSILGPTLEGRMVGVVDIVLGDGQIVRRNVNGGSCPSVSDALAVVVAVTLEAGDTQDASVVPLVLIRSPPKESPPTWSVGGGGLGIATNVLGTGSAVLGVGGQVEFRLGSELADPVVGIGLYRFDNVLFHSTVRDLHLSLTFARLTILPIPLPLSESFELRPGLISEFGAISALEAPLPRDWWAGGVELSLGYVSRWLSVDGSVGAVLPLETQTFSLRRQAGASEPIHTIKRLSVFAQLGAVLWIL